MQLHVGYDIVEVEEIAASLRSHGRRYVDRVFTAAEAGRAPDARRLAGTFAAKEAVVKALGVDDRTPSDWRSIEIDVGARGGAVRLSGHLALLARSRRVSEVEVSIAMRRTYAAAVAVVTLGPATERRTEGVRAVDG